MPQALAYDGQDPCKSNQERVWRCAHTCWRDGLCALRSLVRPSLQAPRPQRRRTRCRRHAAVDMKLSRGFLRLNPVDMTTCQSKNQPQHCAMTLFVANSEQILLQARSRSKKKCCQPLMACRCLQDSIPCVDPDNHSVTQMPVALMVQRPESPGELWGPPCSVLPPCCLQRFEAARLLCSARGGSCH